MRRLLALIVLLSLIFGAGLPVAHPAVAMRCQPSRLLDDAAASRILSTQRPFAPANRDLFLSYERADWADVAPVDDGTGPAPTEQQTKADLRRFLELRFPCSPGHVSEGLAVFDHPIARHKIPDPTLRAALAALTGTIGEPAIAYLLFDVPVSTIHFGVVIGYGEGIPSGNSAATYPAPDGSAEIVFDGTYRFLPFGAFSGLLFHEALHVESPVLSSYASDKPGRAGLPEEATAIAFETLIYMQMVLTDPSLATLPDGLTRSSNNYMALMRLNSGVPGTDRLNLFLPDGDYDIDPISPTPLADFYEYYARTSYDDPDVDAWRARETSGNPLLAAVLPALAEPGQAPPTHPDFDRATLDFIDQNEAALSPAQLVEVACILQLDVPCS